MLRPLMNEPSPRRAPGETWPGCGVPAIRGCGGGGVAAHRDAIQRASQYCRVPPARRQWDHSQRHLDVFLRAILPVEAFHNLCETLSFQMTLVRKSRRR